MLLSKRAHLCRVHILAADRQQDLANGHTRACALGLSKGSAHSSLQHPARSKVMHHMCTFCLQPKDLMALATGDCLDPTSLSTQCLQLPEPDSGARKAAAQSIHMI